MNDDHILPALARAEAILAAKGFFEPPSDLENIDDFQTYQPVIVRPGFIFKKLDRATADGERVVFSVWVLKMGSDVFLEIFQRISNTLEK